MFWVTKATKFQSNVTCLTTHTNQLQNKQTLNHQGIEKGWAPFMMYPATAEPSFTSTAATPPSSIRRERA